MKLDNAVDDKYDIGTWFSKFGVSNNGDPMDTIFNDLKSPIFTYFINNYNNATPDNSTYFPYDLDADDFNSYYSTVFDLMRRSVEYISLKVLSFSSCPINRLVDLSFYCSNFTDLDPYPESVYWKLVFRARNSGNFIMQGV
jgi:hypothetical protein